MPRSCLFTYIWLPFQPAGKCNFCFVSYICLRRRDWFDKPSEDLYGNRVATVLMYLSGEWIYQ